MPNVDPLIGENIPRDAGLCWVLKDKEMLQVKQRPGEAEETGGLGTQTLRNTRHNVRGTYLEIDGR